MARRHYRAAALSACICVACLSWQQESKGWVLGGVRVTGKDLQEAAKEVERAGGHISPSKGRSGFTQEWVCDLEHWAVLCEEIQSTLRLSDQEVAALKSAKSSEQYGASFVESSEVGNEHSTRIVAYRTVRDAVNKKMHLLYGRREVSMQTLSGPMLTGGLHCVKLGNRTFTAWPPASPDCEEYGREVVNKPFTLPSGWTPVAADDKDFASILRHVVRPYCWGTDVLVVKGDEQQPWKAFCTSSDEDDEDYNPCDYFSETGEEGQYAFTDTGRLLVEAGPSQSAELISAWRRYAKLSAQAEWGKYLGLQADDEA